MMYQHEMYTLSKASALTIIERITVQTSVIEDWLTETAHHDGRFMLSLINVQDELCKLHAKPEEAAIVSMLVSEMIILLEHMDTVDWPDITEDQLIALKTNNRALNEWISRVVL